MNDKNNLAMAMAIRAKNKKKMAKGGQVTESASNEMRPMPEQAAASAAMDSRNSDKKPLKQASWTDSPTVAQAQSRPKLQPMKHPKMVPSDAFSARLRSQEDDLEASAHPAQPTEQPDESENELRPDRQGPKVHPAKMMAEGGMMDDEEMQPEPEEEDEHHDSMVAAIMAKRNRMASGGRVDIESNGQEQPNEMDEMNEAALKENYDSDMMDMTQPMDSNEHSDDIDSDSHDMVDQIRRKMAVKRAFR